MKPGRALLALLLVLAPVLVAPGMPAAYAAATLSVTIDAVAPVVAQAGAPVTLTGTIHNSGSTAAPQTDVVVRAAGIDGQSRAAVRDWAQGTGPADGRELARTQTTTPILPGGAARFTVTVTGLAQGMPASWGAVPVAVSVGDAHAHTFLGYQVRKEYEPISLAVAVPILTPADPVLWGTGTEREQAWTALAGATSRPSRIVAATSAHRVDWIVDGTLLTPTHSQTPSPAPTASATPSPSPSPSATFTPSSAMSYADSPAEITARDSLRTTLSAGATAHGTFTLPAADPDLVALTRLAQTRTALATEIEVAASTLTGRTFLGWPAAGAWTGDLERTVQTVLPPVGGQPPSTIVSSEAVNLGHPGFASGATARTADRTSLLISDANLSRTLTEAASGPGGIQDVMHFMADSAALLAERSGTKRSALVVADRSIDPDVTSFDRFLTGIESIPWLTPSSIESLPKADAPTATPTTAPTPAAGPLATDTMAATQARIVAGGQIRADGAEYARRQLQSVLALTGTDWRSNATGWTTLNTQVSTSAATTVAGVQVEPKQITFLAESGRIQITVVNTLDVPVRDVRLTVTPDNPKLRLDTGATTLQIGPNARTTVTLAATALAAGSVPLRTTLTAPDGTVLSNQATVQIQVTPTGNWIYAVVGALGILALLGGLWRSRRARRAASGGAATANGTVGP